MQITLDLCKHEMTYSQARKRISVFMTAVALMLPQHLQKT